MIDAGLSHESMEQDNKEQLCESLCSQWLNPASIIPPQSVRAGATARRKHTKGYHGRQPSLL
ncbi:hypothetical protein BH23PLA1_BH23PLA1_26620 [soil metagenome]